MKFPFGATRRILARIVTFQDHQLWKMDTFMFVDPEEFEEEEEIGEEYTQVLLMGLDGSGKTSVFKNFVYNDFFSKPESTGMRGHFRFNYKGHNIFIQELGGRFRYHEFWEKYYNSKRALIWVVDSIDRGRVTESKEKLDEILGDKRLGSIPILLIFNKQDGKYKMTDELLDEKFPVNHFQDKKIKMIKTNFITLENMNEGFDWLIEQMDSPIQNSNE